MSVRGCVYTYAVHTYILYDYDKVLFILEIS